MEQLEFESTEIKSSGLLTIQLLRPVASFTGSGKFSPFLAGIPKISVSFIASLEEDLDLKFWAGTGTNFDFNVHVKSQRPGVYIPAGDYLFEYDAECNIDTEQKKIYTIGDVKLFKM